MRPAILAAFGLAVLAASIFVAWPLPGELLDRRSLTSLTITDRTGDSLREVLSRQDGRSTVMEGPIPPLVRSAFLAAEDRRFGHHPGVDLLAVARATWTDLRARRIVSGASTIAMQLARQLRPHPRTLAGKGLEALWALRLWAHLPQERILREYLDRVPLGNSTFGVEAASRLYFGRSASRLSAGQAALLAGLARSPARGDPYRRMPDAHRRMVSVLAAMQAMGKLGAEEERLAEVAPVDLVSPGRSFRAPHLTTELLSQLPAMGLDEASRIETTLDPGLQGDVESIVTEELSGLLDRNVHQAAVVVLDNVSGEVLAHVGSAGFFDELHDGQVDGVRSLRQPGSSLKPFAYGLALSRGFTPGSILADVDLHLATPTGDYAPRNYDRRVHGPVRLRTALASSYNVPAVRLAEALGPDRVLNTLRRAGFDDLDRGAGHYGAGVILGDGDVSLLQLARAYRGLSLGGVLAPIREIRAAFGPSGQPLPLPAEQPPRRFLPPDAVALLTDILSDETARSPSFGLDNALRLPFHVAAKTGTSRAYVDNWTAGFTRERTVAVWVGNFDGSAMRSVSGITGAGPIFRRVMERAMRGIVPGLLVDRRRFETATLCPLSGQLAGPACPGVVHEVFLPGTAPRETCAMHRHEAGRTVVDPGPSFLAWAHNEGIEVAARNTDQAPRLVEPDEGDEYLLEPGIPLDSQGVPVQVVAGSPGDLELRTDGGRRVLLGADGTARLPADRGERRVELWARGGAEPLAVAHYLVR